jgi:hypothetical protein
MGAVGELPTAEGCEVRVVRVRVQRADANLEHREKDNSVGPLG